MALHIKDEKADRLARELAKVTGESLTEAVTQALDERLQRARKRKESDTKAGYGALMEILRDIDKAPVLDNRTPDELIGYDENGVPS
jgi:antitoxin VapB